MRKPNWQVPASRTIRKDTRTLFAQKKAQEGVQKKLPAKKDAMIPPSQYEIQGRWAAAFGGDEFLEITIVGDDFELIYTNDPTGVQRQYSRGKIKYRESDGTLFLYPSKGAGKPDAIPGVKYKVMTWRSYELHVLRKPDTRDLYFMAMPSQLMSRQFHPIFSYADYAGAPVIHFLPVTIAE